MTVVQHAALGDIDCSEPGLWEGEIELDGRKVRIDLTIDEEEVSPELLENLLRMTDDLTSLDQAARGAILVDARGDDGAPAALYASHHLTELGDEVLDRLFGTHDRASLKPEALLERLSLVRVGLYPEAELPLLLDYSLGSEITNYVLCVSCSSDGVPEGVDLES